jgi:hypothetical protein
MGEQTRSLEQQLPLTHARPHVRGQQQQGLHVGTAMGEQFRSLEQQLPLTHARRHAH